MRKVAKTIENIKDSEELEYKWDIICPFCGKDIVIGNVNPTFSEIGVKLRELVKKIKEQQDWTKADGTPYRMRIKPYLKIGSHANDVFKIGLGIIFQEFPLPDGTLKIAENLGNDVKEPDSVLFEVKGNLFDLMYPQLYDKYSWWVTAVHRHVESLLKSELGGK